MFREIFEVKSHTMLYPSDDGDIRLYYTVRGNKAFFRVPKADNSGMSDEISVSKDSKMPKFEPEMEIFNYLKSMD